jgi:serine/threonine kinase PknH
VEDSSVEGTPFGRYRLLALLGRGGMGEVWRAHDTETDRIVAIKLLPAALSADADFQHRFRREAHAAARLSNPHVIPIHQYGEIDGRLYVDMRLVEGRDLETVLSSGPLDPDRAVRIIEQVARALHAAHQVGLIHRDVKPSNILLDSDHFAYLIDFGIARTLGETRMTASGNTIGTFAYIAPERLDAATTEDARADVYSLACVLYEALTGHPPFPGDSMAQLVAAHLQAPPPRATAARPGVPGHIDDVIATGMAKQPAHRYATTIQLADAARGALAAVDSGPMPTSGGRRRRIVVIAAVIALVCAGVGTTGYLVTRHRTPAPVATRNTLDGLLLDIDHVDTAMHTTGLRDGDSTTAMADVSSNVSDQACLPVAGALQAKVYAGSGFTSLRGQFVARGGQNVVDQAVVLFPSPEQASSFFDTSARSWQACANRTFTFTRNGSAQAQAVGSVTDTGGMLSATISSADTSSGPCQRALTAAANVVVDIVACTGPPGAAVDIASQVAAKV